VPAGRERKAMMLEREVPSRITAMPMLPSASIVGLGLVGQATNFDGRFTTLALVLAGMPLVVGTVGSTLVSRLRGVS
jgi:hypothetical protein